MQTPAEMLAPEMTAHLTVAPALQPGALCVFEDFRGRMVTARVKAIHDDACRTHIMTVCGLESVQHGVYRTGDTIARDGKFVRGAI